MRRCWLAALRRQEAAIALSPGDRLGPYEIVAPIGSGGMGEVYRARDARLRRDVALKVLRPSLLTPEHVHRLSREARAAGALNHPNIVAVYDVGTEGSIPYIVSELLEGDSLRDVLERGPVPYRKALDYGIQIARALDAAHGKGVCHRDVKPANVFVTADGRVKLLDFGLAVVVRVEGAPASDDPTVSSMSGLGAVCGTAGYMAPEQVVGEPVDARTDIFSLGALLYEMLTGARAFQRPTTIETLNAILKEDPADPMELNPALPPAAVAVVRRCLEKNREERFQSARDLVFDLQQLDQSTSRVQLWSGTTVAARRRWLLAGLAVAAAAVGLLLALWLLRPPTAPSFRQLTFGRGRIGGARFAPEAVVFSQAVGGAAPEVQLTLAHSPESRPLGYAEADVLAARAGQLALSTRRRFAGGERFVGTLAVAPIGGGAPRELLEDVEDADWDPSGVELAVARSKGVGTASRLEYPIGHVLHEAGGSIHSPRVSRDGGSVAFVEDPAGVGIGGRVVVVHRQGKLTVLTRDWARARGLAWSAAGDELWFTAAEGDGEPRALRAVDLDGRDRVVLRVPGSLTLWDVAADGRVLLARDDERMSLVGVPPGGSHERDLSWFDSSGLASLSRDGRLLLFGDRFGAYLRRTDGSPAVKLGLKGAYVDDLSPDGRRVLATTHEGDQLIEFPAGPGEQRLLPTHGMESYSGARWFPDGRRILFSAREPDRRLRSYVMGVSGGSLQALTPEGTWALSVSADGTLAAAVSAEGAISLWPTEGGPPREVPGSEPGDRPVAWSADDGSLWIFRRGEIPTHIVRLEIATGRRQLWKELVPPDPAGVYSIDELQVTPSGDAYFYSYRRVLSELYVADGLR